MCDKNECGDGDGCARQKIRNKKLTKEERYQQNIEKQKLVNVCSKCDLPVEIRVGTNGKYCYACYIVFCLGKMRTAMSKRSGVEIRDGHKAVICVKNSQSISSVSLLYLMNELLYLADKSRFKATVVGIVSCGETDPELQTLINSLENLKNIPLKYVPDSSDTSGKQRITSNKSLVNYLGSTSEFGDSIEWAVIGSCTSRIAGDILSNVTDGSGEHISLDSAACESVNGVNFIKSMRDLTRNEQINVLRRFNHPMPQNITGSTTGTTNPSSVLSGELQNFLYDLDSEYPAQVFAVYRIGAKMIGSTRLDDTSCSVCFRPINYDYDSQALRAAECAKTIDSSGDLTVESLLELASDLDSYDGRYSAPHGNSQSLTQPLCHKCKV